MKKLTSKKGFTLIEMLVVIAIIAVLVAIVVPTVTNSTTKAKAATDAANLRSVAAEASIYVLNNDGTLSSEDAKKISCPKSASLSTDTYPTIYKNAKTGEVTAQYGAYTVSDFQSAATSGTLDATGNGATTGAIATGSASGF